MSEDHMDEKATGRQDTWPAANYFVWPFIAAAAAGDALAAQAGQMAKLLSSAATDSDVPAKLGWSTPNHVRLELSTMDLRDFSRSTEGIPTLVCAPFALHGAAIADLAPRHSIVQALAGNGCHRLFVTDWRSATPDMRLLTIDNYLAELNVAVDEIGEPVDLVGLCQGGWMALIYAARFPAKVRKLVLAGAPVDTEAGASPLSAAAHFLPLGMFDELARLGDGRVLGRRSLELWEPALQGSDAAAALQLDAADYFQHKSLQERFSTWRDSTVDLPGTFYHQTVLWLFKENRLAEGRFTALGRQIDLAEVRHPMYLLAAHDDQVVPPAQLLALRRLVGTPPEDIECATEPGGHLGLYIGAGTMQGAWGRVAQWLTESADA
jgi:poly(3-hydroxyalkanoate) synthetase